MREKIFQATCEIMLLIGIIGAFTIFFIVTKKLLLLGCE